MYIVKKEEEEKINEYVKGLLRKKFSDYLWKEFLSIGYKSTTPKTLVHEFFRYLEADMALKEL